MRKAFTLIEVNLAMLIMAGGILSIVGLYALGFRENGQSREDVAATAMADNVISPLVAAFSATNVTWSSFRQLKNYPGTGDNRGWGEYFDKQTGVVKSDPQSKAVIAFSDALKSLRFAGTPFDGFTTEMSSDVTSGTGMSPALVILHDEDSAVVRIGFRAVRKKKPGLLMSMPLFYTEVRFQGVPQ